MRPRQWTAFEEFVQDHGDALVRLSFALCGDRGKAEDATQEALIRVYLRWSRLEDPLPYARRAVVNATRDSWRHQSRRQQREQVVAGYPADLPPAVDDLVADRDRMTRALLRLPYGQRAVLVLRYWHQLSEQETAEALGNSVGTVKSQANRGLGKLRQELQSDLRPVNQSLRELLVSESQIAEGVREAVDEATSGLRIPAGTAARARAKGRRRRAARGLLAVVPAVGLIAGVTIALHSGDGSAPSRDAASGSASSPAVQTDAYIVHRVEAALGSAGNYLIATSATSGPGQVTTTYEDPSTGTGRSVVSGSGDKVTYWIQTSVSGGEDHWRTTYVDYTTRTWWTKTSHSGALGQDTSGLIVLAANSTPGDLSKALASGEVSVGAKGKVDGHAAIELVYAGNLARKAAAVRFWVDAKTFQPVEIVSPPFTSASTITESWIPKSAANVAQTDKPQVPAGYRQIPPSPAFN